MPSFSLFTSRSKTNTNNGAGSLIQTGNDSVSAGGHVDEKAQRRQLKRNIFRNLLARSTSVSGSRAATRASDHIKSTTIQAREGTFPDNPTSPLSDPNKPLPAAPAFDTKDPTPPAAKAPVKLNRIISPLTVADVRKLFSGAPQFFVRSEGHHAGAPFPSVAFPWNIELEIRDLVDHGQIEDQAWACVTAAQHLTRDVSRTKDVKKEQPQKQRAKWRPTCFERPNMLSTQGLERGTMGFSAALQLGVADSLLEDHEEIDPGSLARHRAKFATDKNNGLRLLQESAVVTKLMELGTAYHEDMYLYNRLTVEMYTELFTQVLYPPTRVTDSDDPYSLPVQIEALLGILKLPRIWFDFSLVEWRIRLGQILWGTPGVDDDDVSINEETLIDPGTQKFWLLTQILLSCELLIRLDMITKSAEKNPNIITDEEVSKFDKEATTSLRWSLILARVWLENIKVEVSTPISPEEKPAGGWLATLTGANPETPADGDVTARFLGRNQARQLSGLVHFARRIDWPRIDVVTEKISQGLLNNSDSLGPSSIGTPLSLTMERPSYFGNGKSAQRPGLSRGLSKQSRVSAFIHPSGWLSYSYLTGLILPGEGLSHFLISTLLENDETAVAHLGDEANLYGGFTYSGKTFWSTSCIVGRVLAAGKGASECMGWLSSSVLPRGVQEGWVNIEVELAPQDVDNTISTARIWKKHQIEKDAYVLGNGDINSVLPGDFDLPLADPTTPDILDVKLTSLDLFNIDESEHATPLASPVTATPTPMSDVTGATTSTGRIGIKTYSTMMQFSVVWVGKEEKPREVNLALTYDVHFVTAHPCVPSPNTMILQAAGEATQDIGKRPGNGNGPHDLYTSHPLHKSFTYTRHSLASVLFFSSNPATTQVDSSHPLASLHTDSQTILIIDCSEALPPSLTNFDSAAPSFASKNPGSPASAKFPASPKISSSPSWTGAQPSAPGSIASPFSASNLSLPGPISNVGLAASEKSQPVAASINLQNSLSPSPSLKPQNTSMIHQQENARKRRFGSDLEMLARAWCAERGYNALVSRRGRNCIACSVREARGLGWKIVLRFG